ncbi:glycosyltransferase family 2 protein, partial [Streptomyces sp. MUM 203J]|uniref:glycosyltransferase family 2 protein n=1 Tax=Streptomyces sp. MUM 203J TaxID=2791990 RepID=UPI001F034978
MPRFSVIVPACHARSRLHACLESVLSQPFEDLELIAVDSGCAAGSPFGSHGSREGALDGSPDDCASLVDEVAARDRRVVTLRAPADGPGHPGGAGPARNTGLDRATGDYVLFLDAADTLLPDALQTIADRLKETGSPDALLFGHARVPWAGTPQPGPGRRLLAQTGPAPFTLADRPGLLRAPAACSAAYSREFLEREGLRFPPGDHEHVPWTYPVLMAAGSLATLDRVCVGQHPRRDRTSRRPSDLFDQYERLFAYVDERPALHRWRAPLFGRMADDLAALFRASARLPRPQRAELARRARAHCRRHRTPGAAATG